MEFEGYKVQCLPTTSHVLKQVFTLTHLLTISSTSPLHWPLLESGHIHPHSRAAPDSHRVGTESGYCLWEVSGDDDG